MQPTINNPGPETDQFTLTKGEDFRKTLHNKDTKWSESKVVEKDGKNYVQIGDPLPGYTGFNKRVMANNIFGRTFADCLHEAKKDDNKLGHEKHKNFHSQLNSDVPFKF